MPEGAEHPVPGKAERPSPRREERPLAEAAPDAWRGPHASVLVTSLARSGGTLVAAMLDGHPECNVFPFEYWHTREKARYEPDAVAGFAALPVGRKLAACGIVRSLGGKLERVHGGAARRRVLRALRRAARDAEGVPELYQLVARVYFEEVQGAWPRPRLVNHCANLCLWSTDELRSVFGESREIVTIRDPRAVWVSRRLRSQKRKGRDLTGADLEALCAAWRRTAERCGSPEPGRLVLRFEDLVADPGRAFARLCRAIDADPEAGDASPTRLGRPRHANSSMTEAHGVRYRGIDPRVSDAWRGQIEPAHRRALEDALAGPMRGLGYALD